MRNFVRATISWIRCHGDHLWGFWTGPNYGWPKERWYFTSTDHCSRCGKSKYKPGVWYD